VGQSGTIVLYITSVGKQRLVHAKRHPVPVTLTMSVQGGTTIIKSVRVS
jgi:hypothetical protein